MGSLFSTPDQPAAPTYQGMTAAQRKENKRNERRQVRLNRPNQTDAFGNQITWNDAGTQSTTTLGDVGQQYATGLASMGQQYMDQASAGIGDTQGAFNDAYGYATANLEPRFEQRRAAEEMRLRNQGLDPTSEAYKSAMNDLALQQNEARNNLVTGIQGQLFNQGLNRFNTQLNALNPGMQFGNQVLNPNANMANGAMINVQQLPVAQYMQQDYNNQMQQYGNELANQQGLMSGLASIGGSILAAPMSGGGSLFGNLAGKAFGL